ncbi:MAG: efflux RND transporter periplasmic adaptor subunit [Planctomycetota bacterium]|jgi:HlyD family secretion protein
MTPTTPYIPFLKYVALLAALTTVLLFGCEREVESVATVSELHTVGLDVVSERVLVAGSVRPSDVVRVQNEVGTGSPPSIMLRAGFKAEYPTLIYLIEEGMEVQEGDLLFEVQSNNLEQIRYEREYYLNWANTNYVEWSERLAVEEIEAEADMMDANLDLEFAQDDLTKFVEGDSPLLLQKLKDAVIRAQNKAEQASDEYQQSIKLNANGYINDTELQADKLLAEERQASLEIAQDELALYERYTYPRQKLKLERQVELEKIGLLRTQVNVESNVARADRYVDYYNEKRTQYQERLEYINNQIEDTKIYAPVSGTVIYASSNGAGRVLNWKPPVEEGDQLYPREEIVHIISSDRMHLSVKLMEMDLYNVKVGQEVQISVEALPDIVYQGRVTEIALLPTRASVYINPDLRQYQARIDIEGDTEGLQPGMNAIGEIILKHAEDVTAVPVQTIVEKEDPATGDLQSVVYVMGERGPEERVVTLGLRNPIMAEVKSGVGVGDRVLLTPPDSNRVKAAPTTDPWIEENRDRIRQGITIQPRSKMTSEPGKDPRVAGSENREKNGGRVKNPKSAYKNPSASYEVGSNATH